MLFSCLQDKVKSAGLNAVIFTGFDVAMGRRFTPQLAGKQAPDVAQAHRMAQINCRNWY